MSSITLLTLSLIVGPIAFGLASLAIADRKKRDIIVSIAALFTVVGGIFFAFEAYRANGMASVELGSWSGLASTGLEFAIIAAVLGIAYKIKNIGIGIFALVQLGLAVAGEVAHGGEAGQTFVIDRLSTILVLIVSVIGGIIVYYAIDYMRQHEEHAPATAASTGRFYFFLIGFLGAMNGLVLANDLKWLSIFWEATTICSFALIGHDGTSEARRNARRALLINMFGGTALMAATYIMSVRYGINSFGGILERTNTVVFALLVLAAMTKSAQMPFQSWLLGAMVAPTPVSALLHSATMVNAGVYIVLRAAPAYAGTKMMYFVALAGAFSFALTSALAIGQSNGKKVLAYSTIANLGLIFTCAGLDTPLAYAAGIMLLCFHSASKGLLFLCMGTIEQRIGSRDIEDMGSLLRKMPATAAITLIGMASMLVPPFGMLLSKWMSIEAAISSPLVLLLLIIGSACTVLFWAKWIGRITTVSYHPYYTYEKLATSKIVSLVALCGIVLVAGFGAIPVYRSVIGPMAVDVYEHILVPPSSWVLLEAVGNIVIWPLLVVVGIALIALIFIFRKLKVENLRAPYLCGENVEGGQKSYEFRSLKDQGEMAWMSSIYLRNIFEEGKTTMWANLIASLIIVSMFAIIGVM